MTPRGWTTAKFGDVAELKYGKSLSAKQRKGGKVPVVGSNGVIGYHDTPLVSGPGIVIGRKGSAGSATWIDSDFWPIDTAFYVNPMAEEGVDARWLYYAISMLRFDKFSEGPVPGLNRHSVAELQLKMPTPIEQRKIAMVLTSVDDAIERGYAVIDQIWSVKRGLMQQLLTRRQGRKRRLSECAKVNVELLGTKGPSFLLQYLDIGAIERPGIIGRGRTLRFSDAPTRARRIARDGDVLVSTVRAVSS